MGQALYRKYRSKSLDEVVGQSHITDLLGRALAADKISHAYLLTGPRGVGKTSIARILAHEINHLPYSDESTHLDIIEIDAASNNGVEDVRDLRERVQLAPVSASKKVYIIDEVHMLSKAAFNALLKTLEEPPSHVVFILATTDADKLPATILSRVQRYNFKPITVADARVHLRKIANLEKIKIDDDALELIAEHGSGSFRDSIGLLDQLQNISSGEISRQDVENLVGLAPQSIIDQILVAYTTGDVPQIVSLVDESDAHGTPAPLLCEQLVRHLRRSIATKPEFLPLLDSLLDVGRSAWPHIKLLTALTALHQLSPKPAAAVTDAPVAKPVITDEKPATKAAKQTKSENLAWPEFIEKIKTTSMAVYTLLSKCGYDFDGQTLTIYAGKPFNKKRLESLKYNQILRAGMEHVGLQSAEIKIHGDSKPPADSQTAAIVAMMGGGEEIDA